MKTEKLKFMIIENNDNEIPNQLSIKSFNIFLFIFVLFVAL